jgi:hypothetical protein
VSSADEVAMVKARIAAGPLSAHDSQPTAPSYPYVVVYADGGIRTSDREADVRVQRNLTWQTTTVGTSAAQVRAALDRLNDQLEDWRPTPANGRTFSKVEHTGSQPVRPDAELADRVVYYATDQWRMVSDPV